MMTGTVTAEETRKQPYDYYCILDLEGKIEILELPVLLFDPNSKQVIDTFHRYVRPVEMTETHINSYIQGKYGNMKKDGVSVADVWHDTAKPWPEVMNEFEQWLLQHNLKFEKNPNSESSHSFAFITCGNWDIRTQIPNQYQICKMDLPNHFTRWINVKQVYNDFFKPKNPVTGMRGLLGRLRIKMEGTHHLGIDDTNNIAKIVAKLMQEGAIFEINGSRGANDPIPQPKKNKELCKFFQSGNCFYGAHCRYIHELPNSS